MSRSADDHHAEDCDCGHCCVACGHEPAKGWLELNDSGRCDSCAEEALEHAMAAAYDAAKDARKYGS